MPRTWKNLKDTRLSAAGQERVKQQVREDVDTLRGLRTRLDLTQAELGKTAQMTQSELSRLEGRSDHLTSTLRRYVEALGGTLEVTAVFGKRRVKITDA